MRELILEKVADAAVSLGLERSRVMTKSLADNLTLPRPRIELDFLPEALAATGRLQGGAKDENGRPLFRKELYEVSLAIAAQALADDPDWLTNFVWRFIAALPRGFDDARGNYVKLRAGQGQWEGFDLRRVGTVEIDPIVKRGYLLHLTAIWRISREEAVDFITQVNFNVKGMDNGQQGQD